MHETPENPRRILTRGRLAAVAAVAVVLAGASALALTGDDSGSSSGSSGGSSDAAAAADDPARRFARCMRDNGIDDFPDPQPSDDGGISIGDAVADQRDTDEFTAAEDACQPILDAAPNPDPDAQQLPPEERAAIQDEWTTAAQCVRDQGFDFPDPEVDEWGHTRLDRQDDPIEQAIEDCLAGSGPGGPP